MNDGEQAGCIRSDYGKVAFNVVRRQRGSKTATEFQEIYRSKNSSATLALLYYIISEDQRNTPYPTRMKLNFIFVYFALRPPFAGNPFSITSRIHVSTFRQDHSYCP